MDAKTPKTHYPYIVMTADSGINSTKTGRLFVGILIFDKKALAWPKFLHKNCSACAYGRIGFSNIRIDHYS